MKRDLKVRLFLLPTLLHQPQLLLHHNKSSPTAFSMEQSMFTGFTEHRDSLPNRCSINFFFGFLFFVSFLNFCSYFSKFLLRLRISAFCSNIISFYELLELFFALFFESLLKVKVDCLIAPASPLQRCQRCQR